jgi:hypothetical protein
MATDAGTTDEKIAISAGGAGLDRLSNQVLGNLEAPLSEESLTRGQPEAVGQRAVVATACSGPPASRGALDPGAVGR